MSPTSPVTDPQLAETAAALARWRNTCPRSARIPDALWSQAAELAQRHGVAPVAVALKLDYKSLKRRLTTGSTTGDAPCTPASPDFVELDLGLSATPAMCVLVLTDRAGRVAASVGRRRRRASA